MAIPEKPESRAEMYLNKIASGSGTIPAQPESRLEQYLDVIANNGGGGGSGGGVLVVNLVYDESTDKNTLDKTWQEIKDAGYAVLVTDNSNEETISIQIYATLAEIQGGNIPGFGSSYGVCFKRFNGTQLESFWYFTTSANGYPAESSGGGGNA